MLTLAFTFGGGLLGWIVGWMIGENEGGDFNIAPAIYAPFGACVGGAVGVVLGTILF